mgnify:CR=1 FL=1
MKTHYELLEVSPTAAPADVKRAFRAIIARYHPDKVHHLGPEFQEIAATRAAELTEAYRVLSHGERRAEYDAQLNGAPAGTPGPTPADRPSAPPGAATPRPEVDDLGQPAGVQFVQERASRDTFVRKAILDRFRQALLHVAGTGYDETPVQGFDISCTPKARLFARARGPRLLGRFVSCVDSASVADAWARAGKLNPAGEDVCVILMGTLVAPPRELADAIAEQRRRPVRGGKVTLIPVNASVWDAHMPTDAPDVAKSLLSRLRTGA